MSKNLLFSGKGTAVDEARPQPVMKRPVLRRLVLAAACLFALLFCFGCATPRRTSKVAANPADVDTIAHLMRASYETVSGPAGVKEQVRQIARDATFVSVSEEKGQIKSKIMSEKAYWAGYHYRKLQVQGANHPGFRQHFSRALYIHALAQPHDAAGRAQARDSLDQAARLLKELPEEAQQLHDSKELLSGIEAEQRKVSRGGAPP